MLTEGRRRQSSKQFLNLSLDVMGSQQQTVADLTPGKTRYPLYKKVDELRGRYGRTGKMSPRTWIRSPDRSARGDSLYRLTVMAAI